MVGTCKGVSNRKEKINENISTSNYILVIINCNVYLRYLLWLSVLMDREKDLQLLQEANSVLEAMDIKGKGYIPVSERIKAFRMIYPRGQILTEIISLQDGVVTMKCEVYDDEGHLLATGHGQEKEGSSFINKTSYIENCETSCTGRALGNLGIGLDKGFASLEEVANAKLQQGENVEIKKTTIGKNEWESLKRMYSKEEIKAMYEELKITKGTDMPIEYFEQKKKEYDEKFAKEHPDQPYF